MKIRIKALDTLFFRDGRPFNMGDESWATGIFPPPPSVLYGVLRSAFLSQAGFNERNIARSGKLIIRQLFLERESDGELLFWAPYDCVVKDKNDRRRKEGFLLQLQDRKAVANYDERLSHQLVAPKGEDGRRLEVETLGGGEYLVSQADFKGYLQRQAPPEEISISKYISMEPKIGIGRSNKTRVSAESQLYRVGMQRLAGTGKGGEKINLIIEFEGIELASEGLLKIGGEGKSAAYESCDEDFALPSPGLSGGLFKLYLATPALFANGWLPDWLDEKGIGTYAGLELRLIAAAIGKPLSIGGFDIKKKTPKPMLKAVPVGSVYYFRLLAGNPEAVVSAFHQKCISDFKPEEGFGLSFLGKVSI